jgi:hypothetical protein
MKALLNWIKFDILDQVPKTSDQFNYKYHKYLEEGYCGIEYSNSYILWLCDLYFRKWIQNPEFRYQQIKPKFGSARVYVENVPSMEDVALEKMIDAYIELIIT